MRRLREISAGVLVATADRGTTNSSVVVGPDGGCLLVDPAITPADLVDLAQGLQDNGLRPDLGFATHPHWDHMLWSRDLGDIPRYALPAAVQLAEQDRDDIVSFVRDSMPGHDLELLGRLVSLPGASNRIPWDGPIAEVIAHDGHAPGHAAVLIPQSGVLLAGDMVSDIEIPLLDLVASDPLGDYRTGLDRLAVVSGVHWVVPGHGHIADAAEFRRRLDTDYRYLDLLVAGHHFDDPRCTDGWLRDRHIEQLQYFGPA